MKKLLTFLLTALLAFGVGWATEVTFDLSTAGSTNGDVISTLTGSNGVTLTFSKGTGSTNPAWYSGVVRLYANGTLTIACNGYTISEIVFTGSTASSTTNGGLNNWSTTTGSYQVTKTTQPCEADWTTTGSVNSLTFTVEAGKRVYLTKIVVTVDDGGSYVAPPTITPDGGNFATSQQVTLSHADADAIYYTLDGTDPTTSSTEYTTPFYITASGTTTVKAIAEKNGVTSSPASATFTNIGVGTIAAAYALDQGSEFIFTGNAVVTYQKGSRLFIRDNSGSGMIYGSGVGTYTNGDILDANWSATNTTYNNSLIHQFGSPTNVASSSNGGAVAPFDKTSTGVTNANVHEYVSFSHVTLSWSTEVGYTYVTIGNNTVYFRDFFYNGLTVVSGHTYDIEGIVYLERKNNSEFPVVYLTSVTEVQPTTPTLLADPTSLTINDSGTGNTFTVEGSNLGDDNVGLTQTDSNFDPTLLATIGTTYDGGNYWGFTPAGGSINGTVAMEYTGRALSASETVTLENNTGASATVTVDYLADLYIVGNFGSGWDFSTGTPMTYNNGTYTASVTVNVGDLILFARKYDTNELWNTRYVFGPNSSGDWWVNGNLATGTIDLYDDDPIYFNSAGTYIIEINASTGALTITKEVVNTGDFVLVTDATDLVMGNEVIIVNSGTAGDTAARTMGERRTNNYYGTGVTVSSTLKVTPTSETQIFTLEQGTGGWYFKTTDDLYLNSMSSGTSNNLQTKAKDANGTGTSLAVINIGSGNVASIVFQGSGSRKTLRYNANNGGASTNTDIFSCYQSATNQADVFIYQRTASTEPCITVNPSTIDIVIPAGETSEQGVAAVTESNTTGTTSVSVSGEDASNFTASLSNGTLTVTYSGTATASDPDVAVVTLNNDGTTATVNVTGYKLPMTVTITPGDGHSFSTSTVTGLIESNVADALIEYSFDGTTWYTYDENDGFTTPDVSNIGGTVTVYARATKNGETATAQATYTRVAPSTKCTADIVFDPTSNNGGVTTWEALQEHISEGTDYISDASMATVFTSNDYDAFRFGSGNYVGHMTFTLKPSAFTGGAVKLTKVTISAARYSSDTDCELTVSTDVNTTGQTLSITADQTNFADYVFNFDGSEITTLTIANVTAGCRVYVHSISLEYNCQAPARVATLADIEANVEQNTQVTVSDELIGAWAVVDGNTKLLWAKDQGNVSIDKRPGKTDGQADYVKDILKYKRILDEAVQQNWDESNWVILDFSGIDKDPFEFVGHKISANSVKGVYSNNVNYTITLSESPALFNEDPLAMDVNEYQGYDGPFPENKLGTKYDLAYNTYVPANFMTDNHNHEVDGKVVGFVADNGALPGLAGDSLYFVNPKNQEVAHIWAVWNGGNEDLFTVYETEHKENENINAWHLNGTFRVNWSYNCTGIDPNESSAHVYGRPTDLVPNMAYEFHAVVMKPNSTRLTVAPQGTADPGTPSQSYVVYPLDMSNGGTPTAVIELNATKTVVGVSYYNLLGVESGKPFEGINIVVTRYSDGSISTQKVLR